MKLNLDDDLAGPTLTQMLRQAGHDVLLPSSIGVAGADDAVHLARAIEGGRVCLSRNYGDFMNLHLLIMKAGGHHPGVFVVRRDDPAKRNMSRADIVRAIRNLSASGLPIADQYHELNPWR